MLKVKRALVTSYVGAVALGWLFAQGLVHFANIFAAPIAGWLVRQQYSGLLQQSNRQTGFSLHDSVPELVRCAAILLVGYVLLRWLYFTPVESPEPSVNENPAPMHLEAFWLI
ncbi:MAG TPA: hypothetical protein VJW20_08825 [Candidatus Angelobacter sp.]|nr:hypothetical protein [Candidatus Angelobacter sp.]